MDIRNADSAKLENCSAQISREAKISDNGSAIFLAIVASGVHVN